MCFHPPRAIASPRCGDGVPAVVRCGNTSTLATFSRYLGGGGFAILQTASGKRRSRRLLLGANDIAFGTDPERQRPLNRDIRKYALAKEKKGIGRELGRVVS